MKTVAVTERIPAPESGRSAALLVFVLLAAYGALLAVATVPAPIGFTVLALLVLGLEVAVGRWAPFPAWVLARVEVGTPFRVLVSALALLVLGVRADVESVPLLIAAVGVLWLQVLRFAGSALAEMYQRQRRMPILLRGLTVPVSIPSSPPSWLSDRATELLTWPTLVLVAVAGGGIVLNGETVGVGLIFATVLITTVPLVAVLRLGIAVLAMRRLPRTRWQRAVSQAVAELEPRVVLYHAGGVDTLYQARSWLALLEQLGDSDDPDIGTPLVILRDPEAFARLGPTSLPVLCVQPSTLMMGMELPMLRLVLYASHATGNLHMLRRAGVRHAFVGHGDSDKPVTLNPFLRAYTELWVAGPAAAERFRRAEPAGLRLDGTDILQVGRPQLDDIDDTAGESSTSTGSPGGIITVLYAPTWEGFADEPHQTSVGELGIALIRALVARNDVRVLYRPHPMAGRRDPAVRAAHRKILRLLNSHHGTTDGAASGLSGGDDSTGGFRAGILQIPEHDPLAQAAIPAEAFGSKLRQDAGRWEWTMHRLAEPGHRQVPGPDYDLLACFQASDVLLCDVSSLITEFLITGKPYGVTNPANRSRQEFEQRCPSIDGGYLIGDTETLDRLYLAVRSPEENDSSAARRNRLSEQLLGPVPAFESFRQAARRDVVRGNTAR